MENMENLAVRLCKAKPDIARASTETKNRMLLAFAEAFLEAEEELLRANREDLDRAADNGISGVMLDRLRLTKERIAGIAGGARKVAALPDPVGEVVSGKALPNGLLLRKVRVPLGAVGIIYEARPNVTADAAALCLKSSNAVLLRGGKEAIHTNQALVQVMRRVITAHGLSPDILLLVEDTSREAAQQMMRLNGTLDVLIPRGGAGLIRTVVENATVPVIETGAGNCHLYVDADADLEMAADILYNAKTSRPSVCNACESLLVHCRVAQDFLPMAWKRLSEHGVVWHGCPGTRAILGERVLPAEDADYAREYLGYEISCKLVDSTEEAIAHINQYSTHHSEAIITRRLEEAAKFTAQVDSAAVYVNASTRFTDGEEFGFGAEIGIATQKLHARGPMGLPELTSTKYVIFGSGQVR